MFTLTFTEPGRSPQSHPVADEETGLVVGRDPACDIVLASKEVSRKHARFYVRAGDLVVEDLGSHNGVVVRGQKIQKPTPLVGSIEVEMGDVKVAIGTTQSGPNKMLKTLPPGAVKAVVPRKPSQRPAARPAAQKKPEAKVLGVGAGAVLRGLGQYAAVQIPLPASALVGRGDECDVVLDDGSVSRRHAQLSRDERGHYRIEDLGSANGTFIDGERVVRPTVLGDGVKLRFGDVELLFWRPPASAGMAPRQRMLVTAAVALVAVFVAIYFVRQRGPEPSGQEAPAVDRPTLLLEQAQAALAADRYEDAARAAQQAIDADPISAAPRRVLALARRELAAQKIFNDAAMKAAVGRGEEALRMLARLDPQSRFFPRARIRAKELATGLLRSASTNCKLEASRGDFRRVVEECRRALDLKCQMQDVDADLMLKSLRQSEKHLGRRATWTCPTDLAPLFREEAEAAETSTAATEKALRARYPEPAIFDAVSLYARGEIGGALRALATARGASSRDVSERIRIVDGRFREGQTAVLRGELSRADEIWAEALQADGALMPPEAPSFHGQQMRSTLAQAHAKLGDERLSKAQYTSAYDEFTRGLALTPKDAHLLDQLARLEKVAEGILAAGASCDQAQVAARITRSTPPSPTHQAAQKALEACQ